MAQETGAQENPLSGGRTGGRGRGRGGRGRGRGGRTSSRSSTLRPAARAIFKGNTDGVKVNVFQCHGENTDKQQSTKAVSVLEQHINKMFTYPDNFAPICRTFTIVPEHGQKDDVGDSHENYMKRLDLLASNTRAVLAIVWGQCSRMIESKLESLDE